MRSRRAYNVTSRLQQYLLVDYKHCCLKPPSEAPQTHAGNMAMDVASTLSYCLATQRLNPPLPGSDIQSRGPGPVIADSILSRICDEQNANQQVPAQAHK